MFDTLPVRRPSLARADEKRLHMDRKPLRWKRNPKKQPRAWTAGDLKKLEPGTLLEDVGGPRGDDGPLERKLWLRVGTHESDWVMGGPAFNWFTTSELPYGYLRVTKTTPRRIALMADVSSSQVIIPVPRDAGLRKTAAEWAESLAGGILAREKAMDALATKIRTMNGREGVVTLLGQPAWRPGWARVTWRYRLRKK